MCSSLRTQRERSVTVFDVETIDQRSGAVSISVSGKNVSTHFKDESGGHRFQHIPEHDKRGRVHTSTVTVAVFNERQRVSVVINEDDIDVTTCRGSGPGGQHRNKTDSAVQIKHIPTGIIVKCESERSQHQNRATAMEQLRVRLFESQQRQANAEHAANKQELVGSGQRGDKVRTYRYQDDQVTDHRLNKKMSLNKFLRGHSFDE